MTVTGFILSPIVLKSAATCSLFWRMNSSMNSREPYTVPDNITNGFGIFIGLFFTYFVYTAFDYTYHTTNMCLNMAVKRHNYPLRRREYKEASMER